MALRERLTYVIDVVGDGATRGINNIKAAASGADGPIGKLKAGLSSLGVSGGVAIAAAGSALVAFGTNAVKAFQESALEAGKFAAATGLAADDASRLLEVAGDVGVAAGTIEGAIDKMTKALAAGSPLIDELGISIQNTEAGVADVNATFLETVDRINAIQDPIKRADAARQIFGRNWKESVEVIGQSAVELEGKLNAVGDAQVFDQDAVDKAQEFREALDNVKDNADRVSRAFAEALVPILSDAAETVTNLVSAYDKLIDKLPGDGGGGGPVGNFVNATLTPLSQLEGALRGLNEASEAIDWALGADEGDVKAVSAVTTSAQEAARAADDLGPRWNAASIELEAASGAFAELGVEAKASADDIDKNTDALVDLGDKAANAALKVGDLSDVFEHFRETIDFGDLLDDITDDFATIKEAQDNLAESGEEGQRDYNRAVRDTQRDLLELLETIDTIPADKKIAIAAEISRAGTDELFRILTELGKGIVVPVSFAPNTQKAFSGVDVGFNPSAGTISGPKFSDLNAAPGLTTVNQIINVPVGSTPTLTNQNIATYQRYNGPR